MYVYVRKRTGNDISVIEATGGIPLSSCRIKTPVRTARLDTGNYTSTFRFDMLGHGVISMNCDGDYIPFLKVNGKHCGVSTAMAFSLIKITAVGSISTPMTAYMMSASHVRRRCGRRRNARLSAMHLPSCEQPSELLRSSATMSAT